MPPVPLQTEHNAIANEAARSSDEEEDYQELPTSRDSDAHPAAESDTDNDDSDPADEADTARDAALLDEGVSDLDYLKSRMKAGIGQAEADDKADSETSSLTDTGPGKEATDSLSDYVYCFCPLACQSPYLLQTALPFAFRPDSYLGAFITSCCITTNLSIDGSPTHNGAVLLHIQICGFCCGPGWTCEIARHPVQCCTIRQCNNDECKKSAPGQQCKTCHVRQHTLCKQSAVYCVCLSTERPLPWATCECGRHVA